MPNKKRLTWKRNEAKFANGWFGFLGKYAVFGVHWDSCLSRNLPVEERKYWKLNCYLPGIKTDLGHYVDEKEAWQDAERILLHWIVNTGLHTEGEPEPKTKLKRREGKTDG